MKITKFIKNAIWFVAVWSGVYFGLYLGIGWVSNLLLAYNIFLGSLLVCVAFVSLFIYVVSQKAKKEWDDGIKGHEDLEEECIKELSEELNPNDLESIRKIKTLFSSKKSIIYFVNSFIYPLVLIGFGSAWGYVIFFATVAIWIFLKSSQEGLEFMQKFYKESPNES